MPALNIPAIPQEVKKLLQFLQEELGVTKIRFPRLQELVLNQYRKKEVND